MDQAFFVFSAPAASRPWSGSGSSMTIALALMLGVLILFATYTGNLMATLAGTFSHMWIILIFVKVKIKNDYPNYRKGKYSGLFFITALEVSVSKPCT